MGLLGGKFARRIKVPRVTGYLFIGLIIGPYVTGLIPESVNKELSVINDIALGLILFAIGNEFEWSHIKRVGLKSLIRLMLFETGAVMFLVTIGFLFLGFNFSFSLLLAAIAVATAPGATLLVIREYHTSGTLTDRLLALVAINNVFSLISFSIIYSFIHFQRGTDWITCLLNPFYVIIVSIALGFFLGRLLAVWENHLDERSELLMVIIGVVLLGAGLGRILHLSPMLISMSIGATITNCSYMHRLIYVEQQQLEQPVYIAFFVLAGTSLHVDMLLQMGAAGVVYIIARAVGKIGGIYLAGLKYKETLPQISRYLGMTMLCQAGVAIGLSYETLADYPETGKLITTIVLSTVIFNETLGPYLVRLGLAKAGEITEFDAMKLQDDYK